MSNRDNLKEWIDQTLLDLPVNREDFFKRLWDDGKINYESDAVLIDDVDENISKLACTALDKRIFTLFILPDNNIHRGAMIFCTILIKYAVKCIKEAIPNKKIIYFGTTLKFKHAIEATYVGNLPVCNAFTYVQSSGKYNKYRDDTKSLIPSEYLPEVICVYNPSNPNEFINSYHPDIVVIDCGKEYEIEWIEDLIKYCKKKNIPVIGWGKNCFSKSIAAFESVEGSIFYYPPGDENLDNTDLSNLFLKDRLHTVTPVILNGVEVSKFDKEFYEAKSILKRLNNKLNGKLKQDALRLAWKYIRITESLTIPVAIYNAEARSFWRTYPLDEHKNSLKSYIEQINKNDAAFSNALENFSNIVFAIISKFEQTLPPYWVALSNYCMDPLLEGQMRVIIFPSKSQKQLFSYTLLSRCNISEEELLTDSRVKLKTLNEYVNPSLEDIELYNSNFVIPLFVGLPDIFNKGIFFEILPQNPQVLIYQHQLGFLKATIQEYNLLEKEHLRKSMKTLKRLSGRSDEINIPTKVDSCTISNEIQKMLVENQGIKGVETSESNTLINIGDLHSELAVLLENNEIDEADYVLDVDISDKKEASNRSIIIENAIEFILEGGYRLLVAPNEQLNIVKSGKLENVFVRSVSVGTKLLLIQNQPRQNLYDLIISRIHNHPSLEIHMAMLKKWEEEFYLGYLIWKDENTHNGLEDFLRLLQQRGSSIVSPLTVSNWLNGVTIRPHDEEDLIRLGDILGIKFIKDNYKRIYAAASRIVGIHISLSRKLNEWLNKKALNNEKDDMALIDEEVGLTFGELKSSIKILQVEKINIIDQPLLASNLGRLEKVQ